MSHRASWGLLPLLLVFAGPFVISLIFALEVLASPASFAAALTHPQFWPALRLSVFSAAFSTLLALGMAILIVGGLHASRWWPGTRTMAGRFLAVPHLAFATGLGFLVMPSGFFARLLAAIAGWQDPPDWQTVHDPNGFLLALALALKEAPFLVWLMAGELARPDLRQTLAAQGQAARSLGHGPGSVWLRVTLPQILPQLFWPLVAVWSYGATVVDMALVLGPTRPPALALVIWSDLNDSDPAANLRGMAGAVLLTSVVAGLAALMRAALWLAGRRFSRFRAAGPSLLGLPGRAGPAAAVILVTLYAAVVLTLVILSFSRNWPFPEILPAAVSISAWKTLAAAPAPLATSLWLAALAASSALAAAILWLETAPPRLDGLMIVLCLLMLALPQLVTAMGQYRFFLHTGLTGTVTGLILAHLLPVTAYVFLVLRGPYRAFDPRWRSTAAALGTGGLSFWFRIKLALLKAPLAAALAIGFAVSMAQFIPAQLTAAGRFTTLPIEAVTLTSGANRPLAAVFALLQILPPLLAFGLAVRLSRPRWRGSDA